MGNRKKRNILKKKKFGIKSLPACGGEKEWKKWNEEEDRKVLQHEVRKPIEIHVWYLWQGFSNPDELRIPPLWRLLWHFLQCPSICCSSALLRAGRSDHPSSLITSVTPPHPGGTRLLPAAREIQGSLVWSLHCRCCTTASYEEEAMLFFTLCSLAVWTPPSPYAPQSVMTQHIRNNSVNVVLEILFLFWNLAKIFAKTWLSSEVDNNPGEIQTETLHKDIL